MSYYRKFILVLLLFANTSFVAQADEGKGGLPQLDFNTYPSLVFWSVVSLIIGYILMKYLVTPNIKSILNNRETNIQNDLVKAKTSSQETAKIKENIINSQKELKSRSQLIVNQALSETKQAIEKKETDINQKLNVTMVHGEKDESVPVVYSKRVLKIFNKADKKLVIIKNGDHSLSSKRWMKKIIMELNLLI